MKTTLEFALDALRDAVNGLDHALDETDRNYWRSEINQAAWTVNVEIHRMFPEHHNHPGRYRPLIH